MVNRLLPTQALEASGDKLPQQDAGSSNSAQRSSGAGSKKLPASDLPASPAQLSLSVNQSYARPPSPIGSATRASTRYLTADLIQAAVECYPAHDSPYSLCAEARRHLESELAKCDPSKPTVILLGDLHGTAADLGLAVTTLASVPKHSRPLLLVEQTKKSLDASFLAAYDIGAELRRGRSTCTVIEEFVCDPGRAGLKLSTRLDTAVNLCTWAIAGTLRVDIDAYDLDKQRPDGFMEVREEPMIGKTDKASEAGGSFTIAQAGIFHMKPFRESLLRRADKPNVITMVVLPERIDSLQPGFTPQDIRRLSYLVGSEGILKLRQADSMVLKFPDCEALKRDNPPFS